ncbi:hypothetical protein F2Q70_00044231 [Brassica cretica]|uniref:Uncharacterized protein n=1 Tax=Brassica cretica TaxID=69181 RepID=A0A8S9KBJ6_BRACR|nr:hypothetical protein F2Q70_00044231 [Brassica cretica]KAF3518046.1 hypothetical protein DY000_02061914 [Brassica cretica]
MLYAIKFCLLIKYKITKPTDRFEQQPSRAISIGHRKIPSPHNSLNGKNRDVTDGGDPVVEQQDSTDPEFSLGSCPLDNSPAELFAYRYFIESQVQKDTPLLDLQETLVSDCVTWKAIVMNA